MTTEPLVEWDKTAWRRATPELEAEMTGARIYFLRCEYEGTTYMAPLGTPAPAGVPVETIRPDANHD